MAGFYCCPCVSKPDCVAYTFTEVDREQQLLEIEKRDHLTEQLILRLSEILSSEEEYSESMNHVLHELAGMIHPDRLYIIETDEYAARASFEWCASGIPPFIADLQNISQESVQKGWRQFTRTCASFIMPDISVLKESNPGSYQILEHFHVKRLIAAPFYQKGKLIGYLVADNYQESDAINTQRLMEMTSFFIGSKIINQRLMMRLEKMSRYDILTGVKNRNALIEDSRRLAVQKESLGVVYADVNNLKKINDEESHEAGDQAIRFAASMLSDAFGMEHVYRQGGDEFVVLLPGISKDTFEAMQHHLLAKMADDHDYFLAAGFLWDEDIGRINDIIHQADHLMYQNKAEYYKHHDRRH